MAATVTNLVFDFIESQAIANDGLSVRELAELRVRFVRTYSSGFDLFEAVHKKCMNAGDKATSEPFSRGAILPSMLSVCGRRAAETTFRCEIAACGIEWVDKFFCGFAEYVRKYVYPEADSRLITAFVCAAATHKSKLTVALFLNEPITQDVLTKSTMIFASPGEREQRAATISATVNDFVMRNRHAAAPHPAQTTTAEIKTFLEKLPREAQLVLDRAA
ncbi:MAG TPA: hypothetical protein VK430_04275 [Xanthobacteraceae bacterium]|nr:hypothetical protein [Xanthobacteraceae bacterium]